MNSVKRETKLAYALIISAVLASLVSALLFLGLQFISRAVIHDYCKKPEVISAQIEKKINSLRTYVKENQITLSSTSELDGWMQKNELTEIVIYHDNMLVYSSHSLSPDFSFPGQPRFPDFYLWHNKYPLNFADGKADVFIKDFFEHRYIDHAAYFNLLIFFLSFISIMVVFIHRKVSYINTLEREIRILEGGDLQYPISIKGTDELSSLAYEIDEMRKAFIAREEYAERVKSATDNLMASISHDLRTPLTALIGYLEVLEGDSLLTAENPYVTKCRKRAAQIKHLTDDLFDYFSVSTHDYGPMETNLSSVDEALGEFTEEYLHLLAQNGFITTHAIEFPDARIQSDKRMIQRVFDNLLSNIQRYANPAYPVRVCSAVSPDGFTLVFENKIRQSSEVRSTGFGLNNCKRIMLLHHGHFECRQEADMFIVKLTFPLH